MYKEKSEQIIKILDIGKIILCFLGFQTPKRKRKGSLFALALFVYVLTTLVNFARNDKNIHF